VSAQANAASLLSLITVSLATAAPASAEPVIESAASGQIAASLSYESTPEENSPYPKVSNAQLAITRGGQRAYSGAVASQLVNCQFGCWPLTVTGITTDSVEVAELESNGEPDVLLHLWSGGAHCCIIDQIYSWSAASSTYGVVERSWGDLRPRLQDLASNGQLEFLTGDDRFAYAFTSYAHSGFPIEIFIFRSGTFIDVTRSYRSLVAADARKWLKAYRANVHRSECLGYLAAWAADEYLLGKRAQVRHTLQHENSLGHLRGELPSSPSGRRYIRQLERLLHKDGY
jgi:hypothetical protein